MSKEAVAVLSPESGDGLILIKLSQLGVLGIYKGSLRWHEGKMGLVHFWRILAPPQLASVRYKYVTCSLLSARVCYNCMVIRKVTYYGYRQETYRRIP
jgi:hypothetical protein